MTLTRREFFGLAGATAVVAPTLPKLAWDASGPSERDATRWIQRKLDRMRPGDTLDFKHRVAKPDHVHVSIKKPPTPDP